MKKYLLLSALHLFFFKTVTFSQTQVGADIDGSFYGGNSGHSVGLNSNGTIVAIGTPYGNSDISGYVRVYRIINGTWTQIGSDINGESNGDTSGYSISLNSDGTIIAIGEINNNLDENILGSGQVRIYQNIGDSWTQIGSDINGGSQYDNFGHSVSLNSEGNILAIGTRWSDTNGNNSGDVRVYQNIGGVWSSVGVAINGESAGDEFGYSVSLNSEGNILAIGGPLNNGNGVNSGHVRVYQNIGGEWTQIGLDINGESAGDEFGYSVSLNSQGNILAVGGPFNNDNGYHSGHARVFENIGGVWTQIGLDINGPSSRYESGRSISLNSDGTLLAIGAPYESIGKSGHTYIYKYIDNNWIQMGNVIEGKTNSDKSGFSVSLSSDGNRVAIGSPLYKSSDIGQTRIFSTDLSSLSTIKLGKNDIDLYLNLDNELVINSLQNKFTNLNIFSFLGKRVLRRKIEKENNIKIDLKFLPDGVYIAKLIVDSKIITRKIIIH